MRPPLALLFIVACGEASVPADPAPASPPPLPAEPTAPEAPVAAPVAEPLLATPGALDAHRWFYFEVPPENGGCGFFDGGFSAQCDPHLMDDPRTYEAVLGEPPRIVRRDGGDAPAVFDVPVEALAGAGALVVALWARLEAPQLWVAGVRDGDVVLAVLDAEDGRLLLSTVVPHPGDAVATGVRIDPPAEVVGLHVRADEPWIGLVRASDLRLLDRQSVGVRLADFEAERAWVRASARARLEMDDATGGEASFVAAGLTVRGSGWTHTIDDPFRCQDYALAAVGTELVVAHNCPASSGAGTLFLDRATGATVADLYPGTIGTIGHSMYRARMRLAVEDERVYLRGDESAGRYVAIVDPTRHRVLGVLVWRS